MTDRRTFQRRGTVAFGWTGIALIFAFAVYGLGSSSSGPADWIGGGGVFGAIMLTVFRLTVWPAVILRDGAVMVRNPILDHYFSNASRVSVTDDQQGVRILFEGGAVPVFALNRSLIDAAMGSRETRRLQVAISKVSGLPRGEGAIHHRDRFGLLRHALFAWVLSAGATFLASQLLASFAS